MIQEKTIDLLTQLARPLIECGVLSQAELDELKEINKQQTGNPDMVVFPRLVKLKEVAKYLGVSATTLHGYINDGKLKRYKFGRRNARITAESLKNLLQDSEH